MSSTRKFGITSDTTGIATGVIVNSLSFNKSAQIAEARNEKGQIIDLAAYSKGESVDIQGLFIGTGVEVGSKITIGEKSYLVESSNKTETNTGFQEASVTARTADEAELWTQTEIDAQTA